MAYPFTYAEKTIEIEIFPSLHNKQITNRFKRKCGPPTSSRRERHSNQSEEIKTFETQYVLEKILLVQKQDARYQRSHNAAIWSRRWRR